jgi:hypothetical protein
MADYAPTQARPDDASSSASDEETIKGDRDEDRLADFSEHDETTGDSPEPEAGHGTASLTPAAATGSAGAAVAMLATSPQGSMLSIPDDTPSVQVCGRPPAQPDDRMAEG